MKYVISMRWLTYLDTCVTTFLIIFGACMNILFVVKLSGHTPPPWPIIMLTIEPKAVIVI
jgi:hypothetical protein